MSKKQQLDVEGVQVRLLSIQEDDYISLTDMARSSSERTDLVLQTWMRNRNTIEFLGLWEELHNPNFNPYEFAGIKIVIRSGKPFTIPILIPCNYMELKSRLI